MRPRTAKVELDFYPRPPQGGRRELVSFWRTDPTISIHALREEGDSRLCAFCSSGPRFLSTPSARRATQPELPFDVGFCISIHALREEGDLGLRYEGDNAKVFLSTPSARRATAERVVVPDRLKDFYPRPPRGGRRIGCATFSGRSNFYPRPPRGGRPQNGHTGRHLRWISIHALREEGDSSCPCTACSSRAFLSTPSARRATV